MHPFWCVINGVKYGPWPAGSIQDVPDEVAALIGAIDAASPGEDPKAGESFEQKVADVVDPKITAAIEEAMNDYKPILFDLTEYDFSSDSEVAVTSTISTATLSEVLLSMGDRTYYASFEYSGVTYTVPLYLKGTYVCADVFKTSNRVVVGLIDFRIYTPAGQQTVVARVTETTTE